MKKNYNTILKKNAPVIWRILFCVLFLSNVTDTLAQIQVGGLVTDSSGYALSGATISVKGTSKGTVTDNDGKFTISVPDQNSILIISYLGYLTQELQVGNHSILNVTLASDVNMLAETVVTAFGISHSQKKLGYSVTKVEGTTITGSREVNVMNSLEGKVAGLNVSGVSSGPSGSANVLIRGTSSLTQNNQPLYVVDGIPIDNTNLSAAGQWGGLDAGDGISGINPDDIASVSVLKGAAATALYGYRAATGAIIITTKRGGGARNGIGVEFNSNLTFDNAHNYREYQSQYGQGIQGNKPATQSEALNAAYSSWGAPLDGSSVVQFDGVSRPYSNVDDNFQNFYRTGSTFTNTLTLNAGNEDASVRFSASHLDNHPVILNSSFNRSSFSMNGDVRLGKKLTAAITGRYITENSHNRSVLSDAPGNPNAGVALMPTSYSVKDIENNYIDEDGNEVTVGDIYTTNPYWAVYQFQNNVTKNRFIGSVDLRYQITSALYASGRLTNDWYNYNFQLITPSGTAYQTQGSMNKDSRNVSELNWQGIVGYSRNLNSNLSLDVFVGANRQQNYFSKQTVTGSTFSIYGLYTEANLLNKTPIDQKTKSVVNSVFGNVELGFRNYLYLTLTGRNDWFSTLSPENNNIFYPSAGLSYIFSDNFTMPSWMSFGKVRVSYAKVGGGAPGPYLLSLTYGLDGSHNGQPLGQINETTLPNANLKPYKVQEFEAGFDIRFMQDRAGIDFTFYNKNTTDDIVQAQISEASGYNNVYLNIGEISNKGIELLIHATPIIKDKFRWETAINLSNNTNKVVSITDDTALKSIALGSSRVTTTALYAVVGLPTSQVGGSGFLTDEATGQNVTLNGLPLGTAQIQYFGTGIHPFQAGWINTFKYGRFGLNFQIDMKSGAVIFSGTNAYASSAGLTEPTLEGRGDDNNYVVPGIDQTTGEANSVQVTPWDYWGNLVNTITEPFVYNANFGKLRQLGVSYDIPSTIFKHSTFQGGTISVVSRNVLLLWSDVPNVDPESNYNIGVNTDNGTYSGSGLELWGLPSTRSIEINLNFSF